MIYGIFQRFLRHSLLCFCLVAIVAVAGCTDGGHTGPVAPTDVLPSNGGNGTIYALLCFADEDPELGLSTKSDRKNITEWLTTIGQMTGLGLEITEFTESHRTLNESAIRTTIGSLNVSANDVLLFYASGHGDRALNGSRWPVLVLETWNWKPKTWEFETVHRTLQAKNARLLISIADVCNGDGQPNPYSGKQSRFSFNMAHWGAGQAAQYQRLFLKYKGSLMMSAASRGQTSTSITTEEERQLFDFPGLGCVFTYIFLQAFYDEVNMAQGNSADWNRIVNASEVEVYADVDGLSIYHVAQDENLLSAP